MSVVSIIATSPGVIEGAKTLGRFVKKAVTYALDSDQYFPGIQREERVTPYFCVDIEGLGQLWSSDAVFELVEVQWPHDHKLPMARISLTQESLQWVNDDFFDEWRKVRISMGYPSTGVYQVGGTFYTQRPRFVMNAKQQTMQLTCFGEAIRMSHTKRRQLWGDPEKGISYAAIAEEMASRYSLNADVRGADRVMKPLLQVNETDWAFLADIAKCQNYTLYVEDGTLHFHSPEYESTNLRFYLLAGNYANLSDFTVSSDVYMKGIRATTTQIDYRKPREPYSISSDLTTEDSVTKAMIATADDPETATEAALLGREVPQEFIVHTTKGDTFPEDMKDEVQGVSEASRWYVVGEATTFGLEMLRPRQVVEVFNVGRYSGEYYVTNVVHKIVGRVYTTSFQLARTWRGRAKTTLQSLGKAGTLVQAGTASVGSAG